MKLRLEQLLRQLRTLLQTVYGERLAEVILFGSRVRGDAVEGSDIDVLVVLHGSVDSVAEVERINPLTAQLSLENDVIISCLFISTVRYANEQSPLLLNIRREGLTV